MARIMVSFMAYSHDFVLPNDQPNAPPMAVSANSPTLALHQHHIVPEAQDGKPYAAHHLLGIDAANPSGRGHIERMGLLTREIIKRYPKHNIHPHYLPIQDPTHIDQIRSTLSNLLSEIQHDSPADEIVLFINPGTPQMQVAQVLVHLQRLFPTRLLQSRPPQYSQDPSKPEFYFTEVEQLRQPAILHQLEQSTPIASQTHESDYCLTQSLQAVYEQARRLAQRPNPTLALVLGETGTGKEHLAHHIHHASGRKGQFCAINCAAYSDELLRSELFGHKKGAFTGATADHKGEFERANGGTLFLDEIGDISPFMQQALLRVLQARTIRPVGGTTDVKIDVQIVAATHRNLYEMAQAGQFRWDLYYRLTIAPLRLPSWRNLPIAERETLLNWMTQVHLPAQVLPQLDFNPDARAHLLAHPLPGNIRQLQGVLHRLCIFADSTTIDLATLLHLVPELAPEMPPRQTLADICAQAAQQALELTGGNKRAAAQRLDIAPNTLTKHLAHWQALQQNF